MMSTFDIEEGMTDAGKSSTPRMVKGGIFAPNDVALIKKALMFYIGHSGDVTELDEKQTVNLLHRLNNRI